MSRNIILVAILALMLSSLTPHLCLAQSNNKEAFYVGSEKCKECHLDIYVGWRSTFHPYKFQRISENNVVGDFSRNNNMTFDGKTTTMFKDDEGYFIRTTGPDDKERDYKIGYVIGGFWKQLYVTEFPNGELHILPVVWVVETQSWSKSDYWSKTIYQYSCSGCHTTGMQLNFDEATDTFSTTWADLGVACESCHGPGSNHLNAAENEKYTTIVNPAKIPDPRRAAMVCGSCHTRGESVDGRYSYPNGYKPGDQLNFIFSEKPKLHPDDSSSANRQQYIDWGKSGHAREGVMCWDCHYSHRKGSANKYQTKLPGSSLCRSCHEVQSKGIHGIHSVNNCIGCHMPSIGKRATKGDVHSHRFNVISPRETINAGNDSEQPNSCNSCHYHKDDKPLDMLNVLEQVTKDRINRIKVD